LFVSHTVYAAGTAAGTTITNKAIVNGANFATQTNTKRTNVRAIAGANWYAQADRIPVIAGALYTNTTTLSNLGNATFGFTVTVTASTQTGAGSLAGNWPWTVYTNGVSYFSGSGTLAAGTPINNVASGASKQIRIIVTVPAAMSSSGWEEFRLSATASAHVNTAAYNGDNGVAYGGSWGSPVADAVAISGTGGTDEYWRLTGGGAPSIYIAKSITSIQVADASGPDNLAVPGATITYTIKVSNAVGAGIANAVVVRDTISAAGPLTMGVAGFNGAASENQWDTRTNGTTVVWSNTSAGGSIEAGNVGFLTITAIVK
jgi:hypothetical protein